MRTVFLFCLAFFYGYALCQSQEIEAKKGSKNYEFFQNGKQLNSYELENLLISDSVASTILEKGKRRQTTAMVLLGCGGVAAGLPFAISASNGNPSDGVNLLGFIVGAVSVVGAISFSFSANTRTRKAVEAYNQNLNANAYVPQLQLLGNADGLGLSLRF